MFACCLVFLLSFTSVIFAEIKVYATVDANRISVDETVNLKVTAEGSEGYPQLDILQVSDFTVISGPSQSSSFHWINGKMSSSKSLSWTMIPNKTGNLTVPPLDVTVDRDRVRLNPISIAVVETGGKDAEAERKDRPLKEPETPAIFLEAKADTDEVYQGEQITVQYKLYTRVNLRQYSVEKKPGGIGFWLEELYAPKQPSLRDTRIGGIRYKVATLYKMALFPTTHGDLVVDPMVLTCTIEVPSRRRVPSLFDDFFSSQFFSKTERRIVRSEPLEFHVKPVPEPGKPDEFSGAVGDFRLTSSMDTTATEANHAVSFTVELEGSGNLGLFQLDEPVFPDGLEVFKPNRSFEQDPFRDQISGIKRLEFVIIPRREGRFLIPATNLTYFNPRTGTWASTSTRVIALDVQPGAQMFDRGEGLTKEEIALLGQDIRYIRTGSVRLKSLNRRKVPTLFWLFGIVGLILFASPRIVGEVRANRKERSVQRKARQALGRARRELRRVRDTGGYQEISEAIYAYFAARMNRAEAGLDARSVQDLLNKNVEQSSIQSMWEILSVCEQAQFAPVDRSGLRYDAVTLARRAGQLLTEIDRKL
ncbi:MAG: BatD family protein [Candidatus Neomarinimicrobiota bacterium]